MKVKKYEVMMQDEWNNLYFIGFYDKLEDAIPEVNEWLEVYNVSIGELTEYASTFGPCFDTEVETDTGEIVMIRGFIR